MSDNDKIAAIDNFRDELEQEIQAVILDMPAWQVGPIKEAIDALITIKANGQCIRVLDLLKNLHTT